MKLDGKTALITGGGTGAGLGIAQAFAAEGCRVAITGRREDKLQQAVAAISGPYEAIYQACDVSNRDQAFDLGKWATEQLGQIDILVCNAGVNIADRRLDVLQPEDWDLLMNVNATGAYNIIHAVLPQMRDRKDGVIISVSSIAGCRASVLGGAAYTAAKHAMTSFTKVIAMEEKNNGIRASVIAPGEINTPILDERPVPVSDEHKAQILQPEDIGAAALFIATLPPRAHISELIIKPTTQEID